MISRLFTTDFLGSSLYGIPLRILRLAMPPFLVVTHSGEFSCSHCPEVDKTYGYRPAAEVSPSRHSDTRPPKIGDCFSLSNLVVHVVWRQVRKVRFLLGGVYSMVFDSNKKRCLTKHHVILRHCQNRHPQVFKGGMLRRVTAG
jgi:hypothetical protein